MNRVFSHGGLRLFLLMLLDESPRHGYDLIRALEDHFLGMYTPSAGTVYPRLAALEEAGLVEHEESEGRKVYRLTDAGRAELEERREDLRDLQERAARTARELAHEIRDEVRGSVRDLRRELRDAMRDVRREERRTARAARDDVRRARHERTATRDAVRERRNASDADDVATGDRLVMRSLQADLEAFESDVLAAARQHRLDSRRMRLVRDALLDARSNVLRALADDVGERPPSSGEEPPEAPAG